jgi:hypothetical protein
MWPLLLIFGFAWLVSSTDRERDRRRLAAPSDPKVLKLVTPTGPTPEEKKAMALKARLQSLRAQYEAFSHYNDPSWLTQYAKEHLAWLLENRDDILTECRQLHEQRLDPAYDVDLFYVHEHDHELYERIMWQARVLAIAERVCFEERETEAEKDETALSQKRVEHARTIGDLFLGYRDFVHYEQDEWIEKYASNLRYQKSLLEQREEIIALDREFHRDTDFIEALKSCAPGIYRRATWRMRALAVADKLAVEPHRLSPEEREQRIIRFRERLLHRLQVKAEDQIALKLQRYFFAQQLRQKSAALGLDEDEIERLEQELRGDLDDEEDTGSGFKQL